MGLKCGIVGLPNVGKSTLFNCLSNAQAQAANFPFCTIEPNIGVITVPDERLTKLTEIVKRGVSSFKVFLAYKGAFDLSDQELEAALRLAKKLGVIVAAHNETSLERQSRIG